MSTSSTEQGLLQSLLNQQIQNSKDLGEVKGGVAGILTQLSGMSDQMIRVDAEMTTIKDFTVIEVGQLKAKQAELEASFNSLRIHVGKLEDEQHVFNHSTTNKFTGYDEVINQARGAGRAINWTKVVIGGLVSLVVGLTTFLGFQLEIKPKAPVEVVTKK